MSKLTKISALVLALLPPVYILSITGWLHTIPNNDYWHFFFTPVLGAQSLPDILQAFFTRSNEHLVVIPNIIFYLNYLLTSGNNIGLHVTNILVVFLSFFSAYKILALSPKPGKTMLAGLAVLLSWFLFSPSSAHNWMLGMSGTAWFTANMFFLAALYFACRTLTAHKPFLYFILLILCSLLGSVTYTTAVFIWVVISCLLLLWFSFFKCRSRLIFTYTGLAVVISAGWFFAYHRPTHHQAPVLNLLALLKYTVAFLGNMYTNKLSVAMVYGAAGLLLFSSLSVLLGRKMVTAGRTDGGKELFIALMPWYTVILYALVNTLANAVARAGWGLKHAVTCRYANITLLFWLGLFLLLWNMIWAGKVGYRHKLRARIAVIIMVAVLVIFPMYKMGFSVVQWFKGTYTRESSLAGLSLQLDVPDARVLQKIIVWSAQEVIDRQPLMAATKHVPFDKQLVPEFYYGRRLTNAGDYTAVESKIIRATDLLEQNRKVCGKPLVEQPCFFLRGQTLNSPKLNYILVTDKQDKMIGAGLPGYPPWDLKDTSRPRDYWAAYFKTDIEPVKVKLWARTAAGDLLRLRIDSFKKKFKPVFF